MRYEEFKAIVIKFFKEINNEVLQNYKEGIPTENLINVLNFGEKNVIFYNEPPTHFAGDKLYINIKHFVGNDGYSIEKFNAQKRNFLEKYFEKIVGADLKKLKDNQEEKQKFDQKKEEEQIAHIYGVDLTDIEVINAKGKTFYKIHKNNDYLMIESNSNLSMIEEFKSAQEESINFQSDNSKQNSEKIFDSMQAKKIEIRFIPINNLEQYKDFIKNLPIEQKNSIDLMDRNKEKLNLEFINISHGFAIDKQGKCLFSEKNNTTGEYEIKSAQTDVYNEKETKQNEADSNINETTDNSNEFPSNTNDDYFNPKYNDKKVDDTLDNPHQTQKEERKGYQKVLYKKPFQNKNGFIDILILSLITGFISGFSVGILFILMK